MTKADQIGGIAKHDLFVISPSDHHPEVEHARIQINGVSVAGYTEHEHRVQWAQDDHLVTEVVLRGATSGIGAGSQGAWACGSQTATESVSRFSAGAGAYTYVASFSRLHGDSYLSEAIFGASIRLKDVYIDGDETVVVFYNTAPSSKTLRAWGLAIAK